MDKTSWKTAIIAEMTASGVYREGLYDSVIDTLAGILEQRDKTYSEFIASGGESCVVRTSDRGAKNMAVNAFLKTWIELNELSLAYWRECMISPSALRKATATAAQAQQSNVLEELLSKIS